MNFFTRFKYVFVLTTLLMALMPSARMMADDIAINAANSPAVGDEEPSTWTKIAIGTYSYALFTSNVDGELEPKAGYELYVRDDDPSCYKIVNWNKGTDLLFTWNRVNNACSVVHQYTGEDSSHGPVNIIEGVEAYSSVNQTSYYDPVSKTFHFFTIYYIDSGGVFGPFEELFEITEDWGYFDVEPFSLGIAIDATNFPDENFRNYLLSQNYGKDGILTEKEIAGIKKISVPQLDIKDLTGIGVFSALTVLYCPYNQLTSLDASKNTALKELYCYDNQLSSLDLSNNTELTFLDCATNQLTSLDVSKNTTLEQLGCYENQLTSLDLSNNTELMSLGCATNQLTSLDISKNTKLLYLGCSTNVLTALDVSNNTDLINLYCSGNQIKTLDLSHNISLRYIDAYDNQLTSLIVSPEMRLKEIYCYANQIKEEAMDALIASLPTVNKGTINALYQVEDLEGNVCTPEQATAAWQKGWDVLQWDESQEAWVNIVEIEMTWVKVATGTYYYKSVYDEPEPGYELYACDNRPGYYKIAKWLYRDVDFQFIWNQTTNACSVSDQYVGIDDYLSYGPLRIVEGANLYSKYAEHTSYYDPETKTFHFFPAYYVDAGSFGQVEELFEITEGLDIPDDIKDIPFENHSVIYNISGQRITKPQRGVNIINGRKVIVK